MKLGSAAEIYLGPEALCIKCSYCVFCKLAPSKPYFWQNFESTFRVP